MTNNLNEKPNFPFTYGDSPENDGERLSDSAVKLAQNKKFQTYLASAFYGFYYLGSQAASVKAIPPEVGEGVANAAAQAGVDPNLTVGKVVGAIDVEVAAGAAAKNGLGGVVNPLPNDMAPLGQPQNVFKGTQANYAGYGDFHARNIGQGQGNRHPNLIPNPPTTPFWKAVNVGAVGVGMIAICLNGAWGNPFAAVVCAGALFEAAKGLISIARG